MKRGILLAGILLSLSLGFGVEVRNLGEELKGLIKEIEASLKKIDEETKKVEVGIIKLRGRVVSKVDVNNLMSFIVLKLEDLTWMPNEVAEKIDKCYILLRGLDEKGLVGLDGLMFTCFTKENHVIIDEKITASGVVNKEELRIGQEIEFYLLPTSLYVWE